MDGEAEKLETKPEDHSSKARAVSWAYLVLVGGFVAGVTIAWVFLLWWLVRRLFQLISG